MTTDIIQHTPIFPGLSPSEEQTVKEEWLLVGDALVRKSKSLEDDMAIAASLERVKQKHDTNSKVYREYVRWLSDIDPTWQDTVPYTNLTLPNKRRRAYKAVAVT